MSIHDDDVVCRFIRPGRDYWHSVEQRPKAKAFKQPSLSLWHEKRVIANQASLDDLLIDSLVGYGQAHHTAGDYREIAREVGDDHGVDLGIVLRWQPNVPCPWQRWRDAHVEVETTTGDHVKSALTEFRRLLSLKARISIAPERFRKLP